MSYLRGDTYIWNDDRYHIWVSDGAEDISQMEWSSGKSAPAALSISYEALDEFTLLRFSEMLFHNKEELLAKIESISEVNQNFGAESLRNNKQQLIELVTRYGKAT